MLTANLSRPTGLSPLSESSSRAAQLLRPSTAALLRSEHRQCRTFWFRVRTKESYGDVHDHARRRPSTPRDQYSASCNWTMPWENKPRQHGVATPLKTAFAHVAYGPLRSKLSSKYINLQDVKSWSDELSGSRPGRGIEDVEREAIDHLFNTGRKRRSIRARHSSSLHGFLNHWHGKNDAGSITPASVLRATTIDETAGPSSRSTSNDSATAEALECGEPKSAKTDNPQVQQQTSSVRTSKPPYAPEGLGQLMEEAVSKQDQDLAQYHAADTTSDSEPSASPQSQYNDLAKYRPVEWNEPDGLREATNEERSKKYDDLGKYNPVVWNEPDGLPRPTPEESSKNYDDLDKYGPVKWNEPDGLQEPTPEEKSKKYRDLDAYRKPFVAAESLLEAHELKQQDPTVRAEPVPKVQVDSVEDPGREYTDLHKYGPVRWNEPDGLRELTPEELSKNYKDLHKYAQYPNAGLVSPRVHPEEASKHYSDLPTYENFHNTGPRIERIHPEVVSKQYKDLDKYELRASAPLAVHASGMGLEGSANAVELASTPDVPTNSLEAPDKFESEGDAWHATAAEIRNDVLQRASRNRTATSPQGSKTHQERQRMEMAQQSSGETAELSPRVLTGNYAKDFPDESATSWNTSNSWSKSTLFPQNLAKHTASAPTATLGTELDECGLSSMDESFPHENARLQPALDRNGGRKTSQSATSSSGHLPFEEDLYSRSPQGLEVNYMEECGGKATWPTWVKHHQGRAAEAEACDAKPVGEAASESQSAQYKMLAYDATTRSVSMAETSAVVHDSKTRADPAEILLRVSNPSKFFPYFSELQAEGYELASGSGDVLVFRKVRYGRLYKNESGAAINPIDMMGRSGASNFASPTGYVNYESPQYRSVTYRQNTEPHGVGEPKKKRSLGRKVVIGTAWMAGTAYAVSVVSEYFSTGGKVF